MSCEIDTVETTYSGLCPHSTKAAWGESAPEKVAFKIGMAATTSGHHGLFVFGSLGARNAMKKVSAADGKSRSPAAFGTTKSREIGILLGDAGRYEV